MSDKPPFQLTVAIFTGLLQGKYPWKMKSLLKEHPFKKCCIFIGSVALFFFILIETYRA